MDQGPDRDLVQEVARLEKEVDLLQKRLGHVEQYLSQDFLRQPLKAPKDPQPEIPWPTPTPLTPPPVQTRGPIPHQLSTHEPLSRTLTQGRSVPAEAPPVRTGPWAMKPLDPDSIPASHEPTPPIASETISEYVIGAKILPKVGAVAIVLAITFFVTLAFSRGWLTGAALIGLGVFASIGIGLYGLTRFDEKEGFGQVLVATGLSGLYVAFASGYSFQHLYSGSETVALFVATSLVGLFLGLWRSSQTFAYLGLFGGVLASWMPLREANHSASIALSAIILGATYLTAVHRRWPWVISVTFVTHVVFAMLMSYYSCATGFVDVLVAWVFASMAGASFLRPRPWFDGITGLDYRAVPGIVASACIATALEFSWHMRLSLTLAPELPHQPVLRYGMVLAALAVSTLSTRLARQEAKESLWTGIVVPALLIAPFVLPAEQAFVMLIVGTGIGWLVGEITKRPAWPLVSLASVTAASVVTVSLQATGANHALLMSQLGTLVVAWAVGTVSIWRLLPGGRTPVVALGATMAGLAIADLVWLVSRPTGVEPYQFVIVSFAILSVSTGLASRIRSLWILTGPSIGFAALSLSSFLVSAGTTPSLPFALVCAFISLGACLWPSAPIEVDGCRTTAWWARFGLGMLAAANVGSFIEGALFAGRGQEMCLLVYMICAVSFAFLHPSVSMARRQHLIWVASVAGAFSVMSAVGLFALSTASAPTSMTHAYLALLTIYIAILTYAWVRLAEQHRDLIIALGSSLWVTGMVEEVYLAVGPASITAHYPVAFAAGTLVLALGFAARRFKEPGFTISSLLLSLFLTVDPVFVTGLDRANAGTLALALMLALVGALWQTPSLSQESTKFIAAARGTMGWLLFTQVVVTILGTIGVQWSRDPMVSIGWTLYASGLLVYGFRRQVREIRVAGIILLFATAAKVMLVDLATTDPAIKVLVLTALGVTMLVVGNTYVRRGNSSLPSA